MVVSLLTAPVPFTPVPTNGKFTLFVAKATSRVCVCVHGVSVACVVCRDIFENCLICTQRILKQFNNIKSAIEYSRKQISLLYMSIFNNISAKEII